MEQVGLRCCGWAVKQGSCFRKLGTSANLATPPCIAWEKWAQCPQEDHRDSSFTRNHQAWGQTQVPIRQQDGCRLLSVNPE